MRGGIYTYYIIDFVFSDWNAKIWAFLAIHIIDSQVRQVTCGNVAAWTGVHAWTHTSISSRQFQGWCNIYIHIIHTCVCITYIIYTCVQSDRYRFVIIYMCMLHIVSYHSTWVMICIEISGNPEVPQGWGWTPGCFFQLVWRPGQEPWRREMGRKEGSLLRPHHSHFCLNLVYHCPQAKFSILKYS